MDHDREDVADIIRASSAGKSARSYFISVIALNDTLSSIRNLFLQLRSFLYIFLVLCLSRIALRRLAEHHVTAVGRQVCLLGTTDLPTCFFCQCCISDDPNHLLSGTAAEVLHIIAK